MIYDKIDLYAYYGVEKPEGARGTLTLYVHNPLPEYSSKRIRPAMLVIPGGAYAFVADREGEPVALRFLERDYHAFLLDYSVKPVKYPYALLEACMAMAFIRENAEKYWVDKDHVGAIGFSAGGHLTSTLATIPDEKEIKDILGDKVNYCRPNAVILSYPVISDEDFGHKGSFENYCGQDKELRLRLSTEKRADKNTCPAFVWSTVGDMGVPLENSVAFTMALRKAGVPFELHIYEKGPHGLSLANSEVNSPNEQVATWFDMAYRWLKEKGFAFTDKN